jgi:hypothetical protein
MSSCGKCAQWVLVRRGVSRSAGPGCKSYRPVVIRCAHHYMSPPGSRSTSVSTPTRRSATLLRRQPSRSRAQGAEAELCSAQGNNRGALRAPRPSCALHKANVGAAGACARLSPSPSASMRGLDTRERSTASYFLFDAARLRSILSEHLIGHLVVGSVTRPMKRIIPERTSRRKKRNG